MLFWDYFNVCYYIITSHKLDWFDLSWHQKAPCGRNLFCCKVQQRHRLKNPKFGPTNKVSLHWELPTYAELPHLTTWFCLFLLWAEHNSRYREGVIQIQKAFSRQARWELPVVYWAWQRRHPNQSTSNKPDGFNGMETFVGSQHWKLVFPHRTMPNGFLMLSVFY